MCLPSNLHRPVFKPGKAWTAWIKTGLLLLLLLLLLLPGLLIPLGLSASNQMLLGNSSLGDGLYLPDQDMQSRTEAWPGNQMGNNGIQRGTNRVGYTAFNQASFAGNAAAGRSVISRRDRHYGIRRSEVGLAMGVSFLFADETWKPGLNSTNDFSDVLANAGLSFHLFYRYKVNEWFGLGAAMHYVQLAPGSDFDNQLIELEGRTEWFIPSLADSPWDVYALTGISVYYDRQYVMKEGVYFALPVGVGVSMPIGESFRLGYEASYRFTSNQALDGSGDISTSRDSFLTQSIRLSFLLPGRRTL